MNIGVLTFLLAAFLLPLPFRYIENEIFAELQIRLALVASVLYVPGLALGAALGVRTYRVENSLGTRAGAGVGAAAGLTGYLVLFAIFAG
ncbi:MAG TPA: hypothetical protein VE225_08995, partial [Rubrobacteraceae bacterium]|nr:hypothetical protein [Rubrobacteraceae bacterium]